MDLQKRSRLRITIYCWLLKCIWNLLLTAVWIQFCKHFDEMCTLITDIHIAYNSIVDAIATYFSWS